MNTDRIEKQILLRTSLTRAWRALSDSAEIHGTWFGMRFEETIPRRNASIRGVIVPTTVNAEVAAAQKAYEGQSVRCLLIEEMEPERLFSIPVVSLRR